MDLWLVERLALLLFIMALVDGMDEVWFAVAGMERGKLNVFEARFTYNQGIVMHWLARRSMDVRFFEWCWLSHLGWLT